MELQVKRVTDNISVPELAYATDGSSGLDLYANLSRAALILPGEHLRVPVGYAVAIPTGFEGQVRARSGLANGDHKIGLTNGIGTIDADYRGEISVLLHNQQKDVSVSGLWVTPGMKIAQLVIVPIAKVVPVEVAELDETARGDGGFGSTGNAAPAGGTSLSATEQAIVAASAAPVVVTDPVVPPTTPVTEGKPKEDDTQEGDDAARQGDQPEFILFDTVNKVIFLGHADKETETVVAIDEAQAEAYIADGAQDRRPQV